MDSLNSTWASIWLVCGVLNGCQATTSPVKDPPHVEDQNAKGDASPPIGAGVESLESQSSILLWNLGRGHYNMDHTPTPLLDGFVEPASDPPWLLKALRRGELFTPVGQEPNQHCLRWTLRGDRATSDRFVEGERTIRLAYELEIRTEPLVVVNPTTLKVALRVHQLGVQLSGPRVEILGAKGRFSGAEEFRCIEGFAVVGGDETFAVVVPGISLVRAYRPVVERRWYRTADVCRASLAREPQLGSLFCYVSSNASRP